MEIKILFQWINFLIFAGGLVYWTRPLLQSFVQQRHKQIRDEIQETSKLLHAVRARFVGFEKKIAGLSQEIDQLKAEMRQMGEIEKRRLVEEAGRFAVRLKEEMSRAADQELRKAKETLHQRALQLAFAVAEKSLRERTEHSDQDRLSRAYLNQLRGLSA